MSKKDHVKNQILYVSNTAHEEQEAKGNRGNRKEINKTKEI